MTHYYLSLPDRRSLIPSIRCSSNVIRSEAVSTFIRAICQRKFWLLSWLLVLLSHALLAQNWNQIIKTAASDRRTSTSGRGANDNFGSSVAISGDYAVVGVYMEDDDATGSNPLTNAGSAIIFKRINGTWTPLQKIVASDRAATDQFGLSVAISGSTIVVGAPQNDTDAAGGNPLTNAGAVYIFSQNQGGTDNWGQVKKIVASDRAIIDNFGLSVAVSGSTIVVGVRAEDEDAAGGNTLTSAGSAYVFSQNQGGTNNWGQLKKIVASDRAASDGFGYSVAISGSTIVVGAPGDDEDAAGGNTLTEAGSAYIFSQNQGGTNNWGQVNKIAASDRRPDDYFGSSVAISGSTLVVGAWGDDDNTGTNVPSMVSLGSAYIFSQNQGGSDNWGQLKKIVASDRGAGVDVFGFSVSIDGSILVVGSYFDYEDATGASSNTLYPPGSAYIFSQNQGGTDNWGQVKKIVASDRGSSDRFGYSVAISGSSVVVGAPLDDKDADGGNLLTDAGSAYMFSQDQDGTDNWGQVQKVVLTIYNGGQLYGYSVSIDGDYAVVGAYLDYWDASAGQFLSKAGSAYILKKAGNSWTELKKIVASDRAINDHFGYSVAISGNTVVVGAPQQDEDATGASPLTDAGSVYVFSQNQGGTNNWGQVKKIVAADRAATDQFGYSVAISGNTLVVGSPSDDEDAAGGNPRVDAGSVYVFSQNQGGADSWGQVKKIVASDRAATDLFGYSVAISGNTVVIGALGDDEDAAGANSLNASGSAYIFSQNQGGTDNWGQVKKIVASDRAATDQFGYSVAISGNTLVVGAPSEDEDAAGANSLTDAGSAYVFSQNQGGTDNWGQVKKIVAAQRAANDVFGLSVAISGNTVVVGSPSEDEDAAGANSLTSSGSAYVFSKDQGGSDNWGQAQKIVASDRAATDYFGISVAISGNALVVGAYQDDEDAAGANTLSSTGSAYVFESAGVSLTSFAAAPAIVCVGSVTTFTATVGGVTGSYSYTLTNGVSSLSGTTTGTPFSQTLIASGTGPQTFTLLIGSNGSTATATTSLTVNSLPTASILTPVSSTLSCTTTSLSLTATGGGSYQWDNNANTAIRTVNSSGTYSVTVTDANGCSSTATTTVSSNTVLSIAAGASLPQANVGVVVSLTASGASSYQWTAPASAPLTTPATASAVSVSLTTAGVQTFTVVATAGACSQSALVSVTALAGPDLSAIMSLPDANFSAGESKGLLMQLQEVNGSLASGSIVITITVPTGYSVSFDNTLTSINVSGGSNNPVAVQNSKWQVSNNVAGQQLTLSINGGESVGANSTLNLGFTIARTTANAGSTSNITINVADDGGGSYDVNRLNNIYARIISGL